EINQKLRAPRRPRPDVSDSTSVAKRENFSKNNPSIKSAAAVTTSPPKSSASKDTGAQKPRTSTRGSAESAPAKSRTSVRGSAGTASAKPRTLVQGSESALDAFHPAIQTWFRRRFAAPTDAQGAGWPAIRDATDVLIAAPTGSGKTLAAFLVAIDQLLTRDRPGPPFASL